MFRQFGWVTVLMCVCAGCGTAAPSPKDLELHANYKVSLYKDGRVVRTWYANGTALTDGKAWMFTDALTGERVFINGEVISEPLQTPIESEKQAKSEATERMALRMGAKFEGLLVRQRINRDRFRQAGKAADYLEQYQGSFPWREDIRDLFRSASMDRESFRRKADEIEKVFRDGGVDLGATWRAEIEQLFSQPDGDAPR